MISKVAKSNILDSTPYCFAALSTPGSDPGEGKFHEDLTGFLRGQRNVLSFPLICRPSMSDPKTRAPKWAMGCAQVRQCEHIQAKRTHIGHATSPHERVIYKHARRGLKSHSGQLWRTAQRDLLTFVWFAIRRETSASMLVFP